MSSQPPSPPDWSRRPAAGATVAAPPTSGAGPFDPRDRPPAGGGTGGAGRKAAAVAGLVAVAVLGAWGGSWLGGRGDGGAVRTVAPTGTGAPGATASSSPSGTPSPSRRQEQPLSGVAEVDAADARAQVRKAGFPVQGKGVEAWGWTDTNGRNLLLTTKSVDRSEGDVVRAATLRVYHLSGLDRKPKQMLTPLRDSGVADCDVEFSLDFVPGSIRVTDTDGDGRGEATVGWSSLCAGDPSPQRIKLALVTKGTYFILRGVGVRATDPPPPAGITFPKASFAPNLPSSKWPEGTYPTTVELFRTLFR